MRVAEEEDGGRGMSRDQGENAEYVHCSTSDREMMKTKNTRNGDTRKDNINTQKTYRCELWWCGVDRLTRASKHHGKYMGVGGGKGLSTSLPSSSLATLLEAAAAAAANKIDAEEAAMRDDRGVANPVVPLIC